MSQFRLGMLPIRIETGRIKNTPKEERFCDHCPQQVEDEYLFVLSCTLYDEIRKSLYQKACSVYNDLDKLDKYGKLLNQDRNKSYSLINIRVMQWCIDCSYGYIDDRMYSLEKPHSSDSSL